MKDAVNRRQPRRQAVEQRPQENRRNQCDGDRRLTQEAMAASEPVLMEIWENQDDAEYDRL